MAAPDGPEATPTEPVKLKGMCGWKINDPVMITGLQSAAGQKLNGRNGVITEFIEESNRFKVELAPGEIHAVKPDNLRYSDKVPAAPASNKQSAEDGSSSTDSEEKKRQKRVKKRKKQAANTFSNFTSFDQTGSGYSGKTREEMTAEEKLHEMMHGPMTETERDQYVRQKTAREKFQQAHTPKSKAAGALGVGDPVTIHGLQSESGQKLNGRSGVIASYIESSGRFQVQLSPNEAPAVKRDNLKYNSDVPDWMRD
mmetsp:Transcript_15448/g.27071  ORF Transcript_15448/g.27071 Transcript_15448/m.27071 type:complete len:255 (+) Transcript_15448:62-826(+)